MAPDRDNDNPSPKAIEEKANDSLEAFRRGSLDEALALANDAYRSGSAFLSKTDASMLRAKVVIAGATIQQGRFQDGERVAREAEETCKRSLGNLHEDTVLATGSIIQSLKFQAKSDQALGIARSAADHAEFELGDGHPSAIRFRIHIVDIQALRGNLEEAVRLGRQIFDRSERQLGQDHVCTLNASMSLGICLWHTHKYDEALQVFSTAETACDRLLGTRHIITVWSRYYLFLALKRKQQLEKAFLCLEKAVSGIYYLQQPWTPMSLTIAFGCALCQLVCGKLDEATGLAVQTLTYARKLQTENNTLEAIALEVLAGVFLEKTGKAVNSLPLMKRSLSIKRAAFGHRNVNVQMTEKLVLELTQGAESEKRRWKGQDPLVAQLLEKPISGDLLTRFLDGALKLQRTHHGSRRGSTVTSPGGTTTSKAANTETKKPGSLAMELFDNMTKNIRSYEVMTQTTRPLGPFRFDLESNSKCRKREVYLKIRPLTPLVETFHWGRMAQLASAPFLAHWALEVKHPADDEGLTWEIRPTADTEMRLEMEFGTWATPAQKDKTREPYQIKTRKRMVGTTTKTDEEINQVALDVLEDLRQKPFTEMEEQALEKVKYLHRVFSKLAELITRDPNKLQSAEQYLHENGIADDNEQVVWNYNLAFKNCQDFAARIAERLCPDGLLRRGSVRRVLELLLILRQAAHVTLQVPRLPPVPPSAQLPPMPLSVPRLPRHPTTTSPPSRAYVPAPPHQDRPHGSRGYAGGHGGAHGGDTATQGWFTATVLAQPPPR